MKSHKSKGTPKNCDNNHFVQLIDNNVEDHGDTPLKDNSSLPAEICTPKIKNDKRKILSYASVGAVGQSSQ